MAVDSDGTVFVADSNNHTIRRIAPDGAVTTVAGLPRRAGAVDGVGSSARFSLPNGIVIDAHGDLIVADSGNHAIRKISRDGTVSTIAGALGIIGRADGLGSAARFDTPSAIAFDADGSLLIVDNNSLAVRRMTSAGLVSTVARFDDELPPAGPSGPGGVTIVGELYSLGLSGVAVDAGGDLIVGLSLSRRLAFSAEVETTRIVRKVSGLGKITLFSGKTLAAGSVFVGTDATGRVVFSDSRDQVIRRLESTGGISTIAGQLGDAGSVDGVGAEVRLQSPSSFAFASDGTIYLSGYTTVRRGVPVSAVSGTAANLVNLSVLTQVGPSETMTLGVAVGGQDTKGPKPILVRAAGPSLSAFGVERVADDPSLDLVAAANGSVIAVNNDWWSDASFMESAISQVGAFPFLSRASKDAGIYQSGLAPGNYTVRVRDNAGRGGTVLAELYDATSTSLFAGALPRLINVSVLKGVAADSPLTVGFVVAGSGTKRVLVRAVGPGLGPLGVAGTMPDPQLTLIQAGVATPIGANNDWGGGTALTTAFASVGAFALPGASKDAALLVTLSPGNYTAQVTGVNGSAGLVLVEVYEVP